MKHIIIIFLAFFAFSVKGQEKVEKKKQVQPVKSISIEKNIEAKTLHTENKGVYVSSNPAVENEKTVEFYDNYIKALEIKIALVKQDELKSIDAKESGWFDEMERNISVANTEREKLVKQ